MDRRTLLALAGASATLAATKLGAVTSGKFPKDFLWGAATAGHQIEGNNVASDMWLLEHVKPTIFAEPSGDACNSLELWPVDLDLVRDLGLNAYRFSLEWARIEPEPGLFSIAMLDHYKAVIEGCRARHITPVVTFNHGTAPRWFAARGSWKNPESPDLFARFCERAARHLAGAIGYASTLNEPNSSIIVAAVFPPQFRDGVRAMKAAAARACNSESFGGFLEDADDLPLVQSHLIAAHKAGKAAIKAIRGDLPVGVNLSLQDDEAEGPNSLRDAKRAAFYRAWLEAARGDDFVGIQNYVRVRWGDKGPLPAPPGAKLDMNGSEVYPPSLANAVRYAHAATGLPIMVTEHGVVTPDDTIRAALIPAAISELQKVIAEGVPLKGYLHWTLMDNFEWFFGYSHTYGLCSLDRTTFKRTPKPSARVLGAIARHNGVV
jgi:beta-glucosidase